MKKTFAIILSIIMLLSCIPVMANAASVDYEGERTFESSFELSSGGSYTVRSGVLTVPSTMTVYVPINATLTVCKGAKLVVLGSLIVQGTLDVEGELYGAERITVDAGGRATADVTFPSLADAGLTGQVNVYYAFSTTGSIYEDQTEGFEANYDVVPPTGVTKQVSINQYLYVKVDILEPEAPFDMYDNSKLLVKFNNIPVEYTQGSSHALVTSSINVTYGEWTKDADFYNEFNIYLPTGEGYTVYGREGEQSADGETVKLKYGQPFSFKVEIDPEYDMSAYEVYIYNGYGWTNLDPSQDLADIEPAKPDEYGYYTISEIKGEHTVYVVGVVANETLLMVGNILDLVRNIFEMISEFFGELLGMLGLGNIAA